MHRRKGAILEQINYKVQENLTCKIFIVRSDVVPRERHRLSPQLIQITKYNKIQLVKNIFSDRLRSSRVSIPTQIPPQSAVSARERARHEIYKKAGHSLKNEKVHRWTLGATPAISAPANWFPFSHKGAREERSTITENQLSFPDGDRKYCIFYFQNRQKWRTEQKLDIAWKNG